MNNQNKKARVSDHCSFCERSLNEVRLMVARGWGLICERCIQQFNEILEHKMGDRPSKQSNDSRDHRGDGEILDFDHSAGVAASIEWITMPAQDLEAAEEFYTGVFGFSVSRFSESFWVFKAGNISGGLDQGLKAHGQGIGFSVTVTDLDKTVELIVKHGGEILKQPYSLGPGAGFCARFRDPNGNVLELFCNSRCI